MDGKKISVITGVHNTGAYLDKCITSVLSQTHSNLEFIIVDNESTDNSAEIVRKYLADDRVKFIQQKNAGPSGARNKGLDVATGDYIAFIDSDDWIEPAKYEKMLDVMQDTGSDIVVCDFNLVYEDGQPEQPKYSNTQDQVIDLQEDLQEYLARCLIKPRTNNYIWSRLYRTETIQNTGLRFESLTLGDDTLLNFQLLAHVDKIAFVKDGFYNYLQRKSSLIHSHARKEPLANCYADQFDFLVKHYKASGNQELIDSLPIFAFTRMRSVFFYSRLAGMTNDKIIEMLKVDWKGRQIANYITGMPTT